MNVPFWSNAFSKFPSMFELYNKKFFVKKVKTSWPKLMYCYVSHWLLTSSPRLFFFLQFRTAGRNSSSRRFSRRSRLSEKKANLMMRLHWLLTKLVTVWGTGIARSMNTSLPGLETRSGCEVIRYLLRYTSVAQKCCQWISNCFDMNVKTYIKD